MLVNGSFSVATDFTKNSCSGFSQRNLETSNKNTTSGRKGAGKRDLEWEEGFRKARLGVEGRVPKPRLGVGGSAGKKPRLGVGERVPETEAWSGRKSTGNRGLSRRECREKPRLGVGERVPETEAWIEIQATR